MGIDKLLSLFAFWSQNNKSKVDDSQAFTSPTPTTSDGEPIEFDGSGMPEGTIWIEDDDGGMGHTDGY